MVGLQHQESEDVEVKLEFTITYDTAESLLGKIIQYNQDWFDDGDKLGRPEAEGPVTGKN